MKLWQGRLSGQMDPLAAKLNQSLPFDRRLGLADVQGSIAWVEGLLGAGVLTGEEAAHLVYGLTMIHGEMEAGQFTLLADDEDIHSAVERRLGELAGPLAGKLHTGRSRNDQVATDFRLWMLQAVKELDEAAHELQKTLVERAERDLDILLPGYTHLQPAQPVLLSHWWLAHFWPLERDRQRLGELARRAAQLPLGAGALAGTGFAVNRFHLAQALGFEAPCPNSLDAVSDRDFAAEFLFDAALIGVHLSRLAEALILFSTREFGFVTLADEYSTGSSLMPQKKNPDLLELARGKSGELTGLLVNLLVTLKGLPSAYDKDLQGDKEPVFAAFDLLMMLLPVVSGVIETLRVNSDRTAAAISPAMMATDLADYLVEKGLPFREAYAAVGRAVRRAVELGVELDTLPLAEWQAVHPCFDASLYEIFDPARAAARRAGWGGTAPSAVREQLEMAKGLVG